MRGQAAEESMYTYKESGIAACPKCQVEAGVRFFIHQPSSTSYCLLNTTS